MEFTNTNICIAPSLFEGNIFYIFRNNGVEVRVEIYHNKVFSDKELTYYERKYLDRNLLNKKL